jgi:hypothetical protein
MRELDNLESLVGVCVEVDSNCIANGRHVVKVSEVNIDYLTKNADRLHLKVLN